MVIIRKIIIGLIIFYQKTLSPDQGLLAVFYPHGYCRFYPHCSEYTKQAIERHGLGRGLVLSFKRIIRCHPWQSPQIDQI